ncbi:MAG: hypothetical protein JSW02_05285 [candidate division WOR-3 bacterium]|nr:MAG: hypothetical protein JSW02_05285 [candidate division WOR-3 bacterium]
MFRCNVSFIKIVILLLFIPLLILRFTAFAQTDQTPVDRDIPKIQEDQREQTPVAPDHGTDIKRDVQTTENDSVPTLTGDTSFDSLDTILSSDSLVSEEPVLAKKEFLFTNLDMQVTALSFIMWILMMCWAAFSS